MKTRFAVPILVGLLGLSTGIAWFGGPKIKWTKRQPPITPITEVTDQREKQLLRILVFGDSGTGSDVQMRIGHAMERVCRESGGCDFAMVAGDLLYEAREGEAAFHKRFEAAYEPLGRLDFWMVPGNHDWYHTDLVDAEVRYSDTSPRWRMPSHDYPIPLLPDWIRIYGLDTTKLHYGIEDGQIERAREELCGARGWRLLLGHHPVYSTGYHSKANGVLKEIEPKLLEPLIEKCGVQVYFSGHEHQQEHLRSPEFDQVIQGAAAKLRPLHKKRKRDPSVRSLVARSTYGFAIVEVSAERLLLRYYGEDGPRGVQPYYCQVLERGDFGDVERRSRECALSPAVDGTEEKD